MTFSLITGLVHPIPKKPFMKRIYLSLLSQNCRILTKLISKVDQLPTRDLDPSFERLVIKMVDKSPMYGIEAVRYHMLRNESSFQQRLSDAPEAIHKFEDLSWLFACNQTNAGILSMALDEAAYLYKVARSVKSATCLEIGRFKGGSTFLMAAALDDESQVVSVDNHTKMTAVFNPQESDAQLLQALRRFGFDKKVNLLVADSTSLPAEEHSYDLVLFDGDHSYEGVLRDWLHYKNAIKLGGHAIFHDAGSTRRFAVPHAGVKKLMDEIEADPQGGFIKKGQAGTIVHFQRVNSSSSN